MAAHKTVRVAIDWTPNTIHSGLFCAVEKGFFAQQGLEVQLLPPDASYSTTPAKQLEKGAVDLAICPSESCIAYHETGRMRLQAIYAILQRDASAIVSTKYTSCAQLAGGVYGSYNAKYEDSTVRAMVTAGGGKGADMRVRGTEGKLSLFEEVKQGRLDATWVFLPWEGLEAEMEGVECHAFRAEEFGVPYGYSPVIARNAGAGADGLSGDVLRRFVSAVGEGYEYAVGHAKEAAGILSPHCEPRRSMEFLERSQERINGFYGDGESALGSMLPARWERWTGWLRQQGLLDQEVDSSDLFTTEFFG